MEEWFLSQFNELEEHFYDIDREIQTFKEWIAEDEKLFGFTQKLQDKEHVSDFPEHMEKQEEEKEELLGDKEHEMEKAELDEGDIIKAKSKLVDMVQEVNQKQIEHVADITNRLNPKELGRE